MSRVVLVHGIAQQLRGPQSLLKDWAPALRDGVRLATGGDLDPRDIDLAFYGDVFRPPGRTRALVEPDLDANDVQDGLERELLLTWWEEAARIDPAVPGPHAPTRLRTPQVVQRALTALSHSAFFAGLTERALVFSLKQVRRYLTEPDLRVAIRTRVAERVTPETRVVVGHSLGSVVAYEVLSAQPAWPVRAFVTLGSPLGIRGLIFDRLEPPPTGGRGSWPGSVRHWTNIADDGDVVALTKALAPLFGSTVDDRVIHNGTRAHDVRPYLTARETGDAVIQGLRADGATL